MSFIISHNLPFWATSLHNSRSLRNWSPSSAAPSLPFPYALAMLPECYSTKRGGPDFSEATPFDQIYYWSG